MCKEEKKNGSGTIKNTHLPFSRKEFFPKDKLVNPLKDNDLL